MKLTKLTLSKIILMVISIFTVILLSKFLFEADNVYSSNNNNFSKKTGQSTYPGVDIISIIQDEATYTIAIHYPEFISESLNREIREYIVNSKQIFLSEVNKDKKYLKDNPASLNILFEIHPIGKDLYSIVFNRESIVTGANGDQSSKVFLIDSNDGAFLQQSDILIDTEFNRNQLYQLLLNEFEQGEKYSPFLLEGYLEEWVKDKENKFSNMYLTSKSIVFKFDQYEVTAGAAGTPKITIPLNRVKDLITDEWKKRMNIMNEDHETQKPPENPKKNDTGSFMEEIDSNTPSSKKQVALTFDDGPHPTNTLEILKLLDQYSAEATFFMLGNRVDFYPDIAREVQEKGHELGNHTWDHKDITALSEEEIEMEIEKTNRVIENTTGEKPTVFRPPYGAINDQIQDIIGIPSVLWTIDTLDWKSHDPKEVLRIVQENVTDGSIILMHDIHGSTVEAVRLVLQYLEDEGYEFVTVSEIDSE